MFAALALIAYITGIYLLFDFFTASGNWLVLVAGIACLWLGGYLWSRRHKDDDDAWWLDMFDLVIEFPYRLVLHGLRALGKAADNDLDLT